MLVISSLGGVVRSGRQGNNRNMDTCTHIHTHMRCGSWRMIRYDEIQGSEETEIECSLRYCRDTFICQWSESVGLFVGRGIYHIRFEVEVRMCVYKCGCVKMEEEERPRVCYLNHDIM